MHPVSFTGQSLPDFEKRFPTHQKEALSLIKATLSPSLSAQSRVYSLHRQSNFDLSEELKG